ncbi:MAG: preprotein translocase subunit SecE [candidate division KSB1 bacterium]|nr:preprotein translocase subunit SecE [candidate division KSB1 bacterium]
MIQKIGKFLRDVKQEMSKVSWPTREELKGQTIIVIMLSLFLSLFVFIVDHVLTWVMNLLY